MQHRDGLEHFVASRSDLFRYRSVLRDPVAVYDAVRGETPTLPDAEGRTIRPLGFQSFSVDRHFRDRDPTGTAILQNALKHFSVDAVDTTVFRRIIHTNRDAGRHVVLVSLPVSDELIGLLPHGEADFAQYRTALDALATSSGATLLDLTDIRDVALFADDNHLNGAGTALATDRVALALRAQR